MLDVRQVARALEFLVATIGEEAGDVPRLARCGARIVGAVLEQVLAVEVRARLSIGDATPQALLGARKLAALSRQREAIPELSRIDLLLVIGRPGRERLRLVRSIAEQEAPWEGQGDRRW